MSTLELFLHAIEHRMGFKEGFFVPLICTVSSKFPVIRKKQMQVFCIDGSYKECISSEEIVFNSNEKSDETITEEITLKTMENILGFYGI